MTFSADAWRRNEDLYAAIRDMAFNRELGDGTLRMEVFQHYIVQDAHYLVAFAQGLAVAAAKSDSPDHVIQFAQSAAGAIAVERGLHNQYFEQFGLSPDTVSATPVSPTCHHYTTFLLATGFREPLPVLLAAMLPCFWIYREIGKHIFECAAPRNPYRAWIDTYAGEDFSEAVDRMIMTTDHVGLGANAAIETAMHRAFTRASQLEWMFWDSAYRLEQWPV
jgi:thiaminase/transcriptional activator TenA